jgi:hypothetical protein
MSYLPTPLAMTFEQWPIIRKVGTRLWEDVNWDAQGHRSIINTKLGTICQFMYRNMVSVHSQMRVTCSKDDWGCKLYADQGSFQTAVW